VATGTLTYGGTIIVTNLGPALSAGDRFTLFRPAGNGDFDNVILPVLPGGFGWVTNLTVDGSISIVQVLNPNPTNITTQVSGGNLTLTWPADHTGWELQAQTNALNVGLGANWYVVAGSTATNQWVVPINTANAAVFYRLALP